MVNRVAPLYTLSSCTKVEVRWIPTSEPVFVADEVQSTSARTSYSEGHLSTAADAPHGWHTTIERPSVSCQQCESLGPVIQEIMSIVAEMCERPQAHTFYDPRAGERKDEVLSDPTHARSQARYRHPSQPLSRGPLPLLERALTQLRGYHTDLAHQTRQRSPMSDLISSDPLPQRLREPMSKGPYLSGKRDRGQAGHASEAEVGPHKKRIRVQSPARGSYGPSHPASGSPAGREPPDVAGPYKMQSQHHPHDRHTVEALLHPHTRTSSTYSTPPSPSYDSASHFVFPSPSSIQSGIVSDFSPALSLAPIRVPSSTTSMPSPDGSATKLFPPSSHTSLHAAATASHLADLQRQVTLKNLSMQTLSSEHASLLKKVQRERARTLAIERKTVVAEEEINALTTQNEDLAVQIKSLQLQLEISDGKRQDSQQDFVREKAQWVKMMEMSNKMQARASAEKKEWQDEKTRLLGLSSRVEAVRDVQRAPQASGAPTERTPLQTHNVLLAETGPSGELTELRALVGVLTVHVRTLRAALQESRQLSNKLMLDAKAMMDDSASAIASADAALRATTSRLSPTQTNMEGFFTAPDR